MDVIRLFLGSCGFGAHRAPAFSVGHGGEGAACL
jgi:hypothetical protein